MAASMEDDDAKSSCILMLQEECSPADITIVVQTLLKILRNVASNPTEEKYRSLRKENAGFKQKAWRWDSAQQFLYATGWIDADDCIVLPDDSQVTASIRLLEQTQKENASLTNGGVNRVNGASLSKEELEKKQRIAEDQKRIQDQLRREKEERKRLTDQIKADRKDVNSKESKNSKARKMTGKGDIKKFGDIGINLNEGGG